MHHLHACQLVTVPVLLSTTQRRRQVVIDVAFSQEKPAWMTAVAEVVSSGDCPGVNKWSVKDWDVDELIGKNFLFFEAQESGKLRSNHRIEWRGDSYLNDKIKVGGQTRSLAGGWFDAGGAGSDAD
jgi:hypothetical protein